MEVLTIGHSNHPPERFIELLRKSRVTAIADVRTSPYSRHHEHYCREALREELRHNGIAYVFLGKQLGGRPSEPEFYSDGVADYEKMAMAPAFSAGLDRVVEGAKRHRIALLCSEYDPLDCHRCLLVGRALVKRGVRVVHVLGHGKVATHAEAEDRLLELTGRSADDLFATREDRLAAAYLDRGRKVAFAELSPDACTSVAAE